LNRGHKASYNFQFANSHCSLSPTTLFPLREPSNFWSPASFIQRLGFFIGAALPQPPGTSSITIVAPPLNGLLLRLFLSRITQHLSPKLPSLASHSCRRRRASTSSVFKPTVVRCDCRSRSTPASYRYSATSEPLSSAAISDEGFTLRSRKSSWSYDKLVSS